jgi:CheY-like chemotaxis protein
VMDRIVEVPDDFIDLIRDALMHLYDPAHLQTHPLLVAVSTPQGLVKTRGTLLRQTLLDAIEALRPESTTPIESRPWRTYRILELRYLEGQDIDEIADQFGVSRSQYHRQHQRALQAVASILWERWQLDQRWRMVASSLNDAESKATRVELDKLQTAHGTPWIDASAVIHDVTTLLEPLCAQHGTELRLAPMDNLPPVPGDRIMLRHALLTILSHTISTGINRTISVASTVRSSELQIQVMGLAAGPLPPNRMGIEKSSPFVQALKGRITYQSLTPDPNSWNICLTLPIGRAPVVLVVDNSVDFIHLIRRYLAGSDWQVIGATDIEGAFQLAREQRPKAILLDVVIPGRDGWELLLELKKTSDTHDIPVIVCSVIDEPEVAKSLGAICYLPKPIDQHQLTRALAEVM